MSFVVLAVTIAMWVFGAWLWGVPGVQSLPDPIRKPVKVIAAVLFVGGLLGILGSQAIACQIFDACVSSSSTQYDNSFR